MITPIIHDLVAETEALTSLKRFFEAWRRLTKPAEPATQLLAFLKEYRELQSFVSEPKHTIVPQQLDPIRLVQFCEAFQPIFAKLRREGELVDIWSVAGLKRDELRHASVLAWFLDPNASHGFEQEIFHSWMSRLSFPGEPRLQPSLWRSYRVMTEVCDSDNRVDIEISGKDFYLCVEVKIDAVEGKEQLRRYLDLARSKAGSRYFRVVYLSRDEPKKLSTDSETDSEKVVSTTWATFAAAIRSWQKQSSLSSAGF